jgi:hypothetical protein
MYAALNQKLKDLPIWWQIVITGLAVLPAVSSGLQKEWQVGAREQGHVLLAQECRLLNKQLAFYIAFPPENARAAIETWYGRYAETISKSVLLPGH